MVLKKGNEVNDLECLRICGSAEEVYCMTDFKHQSATRNHGVEVFRCLLMFMIVLYHCTKFGIFSECNEWWIFCFTALLLWHVDGFVAISGWFGIRPTLAKFMRLYGVVLFYSVVSFMYVTLKSGELTFRNFKLIGGWFVGAYLALMMIAPILNAAVDGLVGNSKKTFISAWLLAFAMMTLQWLPGHLFTGVAPWGVSGGTIFTLGFVYFTARGLKCVLERPVSLKIIYCGFTCFIIVSILIQVFRSLTGHEISTISTSKLFGYDSPHIICMAILALLLFAYHVKLPTMFERFFAFCGPSMFAVYLLHGPCAFGHSLYIETQKFIVSHTALHPVAIIVISAVLVWTFCLIVDLMRRMGGWAMVSIYSRIRK